MSIVIRNLQKAVKLSIKQMHLDINLLRKLSGYESYGLGVMLVSDEKIKEFNSVYRAVDEVTDVLAFPYHEISPDCAGQIPNTEEEERILGDIVLGVPYILEESQKHNEHFESVLMTMVTHGICHLVGFDHETEDQWAQMYKKELDILQRFNKLTGYKSSPLLGVGHTVNN